MDISNSQGQVLPQDPNSIVSISALEELDATSFAAIIPRVLATIRNQPNVAYSAKFQDLFQRYASEPLVVSAVSTILRQQSNSGDELQTIFAATNCLFPLSEDQLVLYRPALVDLSNIDSNGLSNPRFTGCLALQAKDIIRFTDDRTATWTPTHKGDGMAQRTLRERVHTADQMRPHVPGLLGWLQDGNWPPYSECEEQLARFPELAVDGISSIIMEPKNRADGEWVLNMLNFVEYHVPVGQLWEKLYPQVQDMTANPSGDMEESGLLEYAPDWMKIVDTWRNNGHTS